MVRRILASAAVLVAAGAASSSPAQLYITAPTGDEAHIMCEIAISGSNVRLGSGEVANTPEASSRFEYYAKKYAEETGQRVYPDCERYNSITDEWRARWEIGSSWVTDEGETITIEKATFLPDDWASKPTPEELKQQRQSNAKKKVEKKPPSEQAQTDQTPPEPAKSSAQIAAEEAAKRRAEREAEFQAKQAEYERKVAEREKQVAEYEQAKQEVAEQKQRSQEAADAAALTFKKQQEDYAEQVRRHEEQEAAANELRAEWDKRNGLGSKQKASTDDDANRCITTPEIQQNATFKGNTAANIVNGCGQPIDVRICLMTESNGWNCGAAFGIQSQAKWSWSSFHASGPVFVDARVSTSDRKLASPN